MLTLTASRREWSGIIRPLYSSRGTQLLSTCYKWLHFTCYYVWRKCKRTLALYKWAKWNERSLLHQLYPLSGCIILSLLFASVFTLSSGPHDHRCLFQRSKSTLTFSPWKSLAISIHCSQHPLVSLVSPVYLHLNERNKLYCNLMDAAIGRLFFTLLLPHFFEQSLLSSVIRRKFTCLSHDFVSSQVSSRTLTSLTWYLKDWYTVAFTFIPSNGVCFILIMRSFTSLNVYSPFCLSARLLSSALFISSSCRSSWDTDRAVCAYSFTVELLLFHSRAHRETHWDERRRE